MSPLEDDVTASETLAEEDKTQRELDPFVLDPPRKTQGGQLDISGDNKTVAEWINGKARQRSTGETVGKVQRQFAVMVIQGRRFEAQERRLGGAHLWRTP